MSELSELTKKELVAKAEELGLAIDGTKTDLVGRIEEALALAEAPVEEVKEEVVEEVVEEVKEAPKKAKKGALPEVGAGLDAGEFVRLAYLGVLKREADAGGLQHYTSALMLNGLTEQQVLDDLSNSEEAKAL